ncbi:MAG: ATP-binding protein, partial [Thermodesulfobacteriota bacterium]
MKLTHRTYLYTIGLILAATAAYFYLTHINNKRLLHDAGLMDARRLGNAFFGELTTSMNLGGGIEGDRLVVVRYKNIEGLEGIKAIHGPIIESAYGVEADEVAVDDFEREGLKGVERSEIITSGSDGHRSMRLVLPIRLQEQCIACHRAPVGTVAGAVSLSVSLERYEAILASHERYMLLGAFAILILATITILVMLRRRVLSPLLLLRKGLDAIHGGDLQKRVSITTGDEFEEVGRAFNEMAVYLEKSSAGLDEVIVKYSSLVEMAADAILLIESDSMKVVEANRAAVLLTGYSKEELFSMTSSEFYETGLARKAHELLFRRWVFDGKGYAFDTVIQKKQGSAVHIDIAASTVEIGGRKLILELWRDVSERKCLEDGLRSKIIELEERVSERTKELEEAYEKLKRSQQKIVQSTKLISLGEMGAGIAHELNSPLAGILTIVEVLLGRMDKEDRNYALLEKVKDAALRSKHIIQDMLSYARPFKGDFEPLSLNTVLKSTLSLFVSEVNAADVEIRLNLCSDLPEVWGSRGQLMEVMLNLIKNARDSISSYGSISLSTHILEENGAHMAVAEIKDTGAGIPDEVIERVFDPFFSTKDKGGGLNIGLGLSISQSIVKEHGGRL